MASGKLLNRTKGIIICILVIFASGCRNLPASGQSDALDASGINLTEAFSSEYRLTLQADVMSTAVRLSVITPEVTSTTVVSPGAGSTVVPGDPLASRTGPCPQPEGFVVQFRLGFCLSTPTDWILANVDGGLAATLNTTPGQAVSIQPSWANSTAMCNLMIYIAAEMSPEGHLARRHDEFANQPATTALGPIAMQSLGSLALPGFSWEVGNISGEVFADVVGAGRIAHISFSGTDCSVENLLPVLETLRFNNSEF